MPIRLPKSNMKSTEPINNQTKQDKFNQTVQAID